MPSYAQSVATGMSIYNTGGAGTNLPGAGCNAGGCHGPTGPAVGTSANHKLASNNTARIANAIATNIGGMGGITLTAAQLRSLALYIGQIKAPLPANGSLTVAPNTAGTIDVYPLLASDGTGGAAQDVNGVTAGNGAHGTTSVSVVANAAAGTIAYNVTYTPAANFVGNDSFTYTITNPAGAATRTISVTVTGSAPVVSQPTITTPLNTPATLDLAPFLTIPGATGVLILASPAHGTATVSGTRVTFTPANNYFGPDTFTYAAINQFGTSSPGTVSVTVTGRADPSRDPGVTGMINAQVDAALRFSRTQISNFQRRMESLHRGSSITDPAAAARQQSSPERLAVAGPSPSTMAAAATMKQLAGDTAPGQDPIRLAGASAPPPLPDGQGGAAVINKLAPLATDAMSIMTSRSVNLGSLTGKGAAAAAPGAEQDAGINFWVEGNASFGTRDAKGDASGVDFSTSGISFGADRRFGEQWVLGMGGGYARDKTEIGTDGTRSRAQGYAGALYGSYQPGRNIFIDGLIGAGTLEFDMHRFVAPIATYAEATRSGYQIFGSLAAGYEHRNNGLLISPYGRLDYSRDRVDQVTETGVGQFAVTYFKETTTSVQGALGVRAESAHATSFGWAAPRMRVELRHEFDGDRQAQLAYADLLAQRYAVSTGAIARGALAIGIGSDFVTRDGLTLGFDYQYLHAFGENASHAFRVRLSKELDGPGSTAALRAAAGTATAPLDIRVDVGYMYDDNVTRSRTTGDKLFDHAYSVNAGKVIVIPVTDNIRGLLGGSVGAEKFRNYDGLSRAYGSATGEMQYRASGEFTSPTFGLFARVTAENYQSSLRDGYRAALGISMRQPITDRIDLFAALSHNERYADSSVFSTRDNSVRANFDWSVGPRSLVYIGAEYRRGDIVSSGRPSLEDVDIAKVLVADDAYPGKNFFAYRFDGDTVLTTLGYNLGLGPTDSLDFSWRRAESTPSLRPSFATSSSSYVANQYFIVYLTRF